MPGRQGRALRPGGWRSGLVADRPGYADSQELGRKVSTLELSDAHFAEKRPGPQNPRPEDTLHSQA